MKALSLTQPWAWSIVHAGKRVENRSDRRGRPPMCGYRGPLLLHAAKGMTIADYESAVSFMVGRGVARTKHGAGELPVVPPRLQDVGDEMLPRGVIVGRCNVVGSIEPWDCSQCGSWPPQHRGTCGACSGTLEPSFDLRWWMGGYALVLEDVEPTPWVPCRGMLGLWTAPADVLKRLEAA